MSKECMQRRLGRLVELVDKEAYKENSTIGDGAYVNIMNELLSLHKDASHANTVKRLIFKSDVLRSNVSVTDDHLRDLDSFVDSVENIMRVERSIEEYEAEKSQWEEGGRVDFKIVEKYEEDAVMSYVIGKTGFRLFEDSCSYNVEWLKNAVEDAVEDIGDERKFLEKQFLRLDEWYKKELRLEYAGLEISWSSLKADWFECQDMLTFIERTYKSIEFIRKHNVDSIEI